MAPVAVVVVVATVLVEVEAAAGVRRHLSSLSCPRAGAYARGIAADDRYAIARSRQRSVRK